MITTEASLSENTGKKVKTLAYYTAFIALGLASAVLGPTLPGLAEQTHTQLSEIGILFTARSLGYLIGSLQGGRWLDRLPAHPLMALMLAMMAVALAVIPMIPVLWFLAFILLGLGIAEGIVDLGGNTALVWIHKRRVAPYMNGLHFFFGVGTFIAPIVVSRALLLRNDIAWAYWGLAILMLPVAIWLYRLPGPTSEADPGENGLETANPRLVLLLIMFFFLYVGAEISFGGWIFTYARAENLVDQPTAALLTSAFWGAFTIGRLVAIPISMRVSPQFVLLASLMGALANLGLFLAWPGSVLVIWPATIGFGFSIASIFPTTLAFAGQRLALSGRITSWFFIGASIGAMTLPWLTGLILNSLGPRAMVFTIGLDLLGGLAVFALFFLFTPGRATGLGEPGAV